MERRPLLIVGAGPAGTASALFLSARHPELARDSLVLDKACHPRMKVCAGGLIPHTVDCLNELGIGLDVPHVAVHRARVDLPGRVVTYDSRNLCHVVRRDEFDHALVGACRRRGIEVRDGEKVVALRRESDGVRVETERETYHARLVVGADGSGSAVRRQLITAAPGRIGKAIMCEVPLAQTAWDGGAAQRYDFDFVPVTAGLRGYAWAFPCLIAGVSSVNIGVYSVEAADRGRALHRVLAAYLARLGLGPQPLRSFPIRWYSRAEPIAAARVLLAGDAAGVDPLLGEGISFAFEYGRRVAAVAERMIAGDDTAATAYGRSVADSWMGRKLERLSLATQLLYGRSGRLWFALAGRSRRLQEIAVRWYNGIDGWDRLPARDLARAWLYGEDATLPLR